MRLLKIKLENFRNHGSLELDFSGDPQRITYLVGPNACGKTNVLEAIYLLALIKSFRTSSQADLIRWGDEFCRVTGEFEAEGADRLTLEVFYGRPPQPQKSLKKNKVRVGAENFIGSCQVVFFHPEDLNMLYLGPDLRRRYLDILNIQVSKDYYRALRRYRQALKQRNALIKAIKEGYAQRGELGVWDEQLAENGCVLIEKRTGAVEYLNANLERIYRKIAQSKDRIEVSYARSVGISGENHKAAYLAALEAAQKTDFQAEFTTVGPHRDDLVFALNGRPLHAHASRGEYRSLLLALKLLELEYFMEKTGNKPILLLDDVFSELDPDRQKMLMAAVPGCQTIITAGHLDEHVLSRTHSGLGMERQTGDVRFRVLTSE